MMSTIFLSGSKFERAWAAMVAEPSYPREKKQQKITKYLESSCASSADDADDPEPPALTPSASTVRVVERDVRILEQGGRRLFDNKFDNNEELETFVAAMEAEEVAMAIGIQGAASAVPAVSDIEMLAFEFSDPGMRFQAPERAFPQVFPA